MFAPLGNRLWLILALAGLPLFGQSGIGKITGVVTDPSGSAIPNAEVEARNNDTGETRHAATNFDGVYVVSPLPAGIYTLQVHQNGFKTMTRTDIHIDVNSAPSIDMTLQVGAVSEHVEVSAAAPIIDTENGSISDSRFAMQLQNLPLPVREVSQVVGQVAGIPYGTQSTVGGTWEYNGGRSALGVISDGALVNPMQTEGWPSIGGINRRADLTIPGIDSISEVQFVPSGGDAQYLQPVQVIISSKSGTNEFHGSGFEYYSSGGLGARRWEAASVGGFVRHQFGGTVGGPIIRNKMFFTFGLDGFRYSLNNVLNGRYPTSAERGGDLSDLLKRTTATGAASPVNLFDPLNKGTYFPNNVIPASRIDPIATNLLTLIPAGATPVGALTNNNVVYSKPEFDNSDKYDYRFDYNANSRDRIFGRTTVAGLDQAVAFLGAVPGYYGYSGKHERTEAVVGNWTRTINSTTIAVFEFTFRSMPFKAQPSPEGNTLYSIPIVNVNPTPPFAGPPSISIGSNGLDITDIFSRKLFNVSADYGYSFDPNVTKVIGNHTLKAGFDFYRSYKTNQIAAPPYGSYKTASDFNNLASTTSATGDAYADFLLGFPTSTSVTIGPAGAWLSKTNFDFFLQDDWKVNSRLTINLGLRYDKLGFLEEMNKRESSIDFKNGKILIPDNSQSLIQPAFQPYQSMFETASQAGLPDTLVKPTNLDFVPRIGAAFRVTPTMVVRGGFGIYNVDVNLNQFSSMINTPPFIYTAALSRSLLLTQGINVNSLYTFENPTANGSTAEAAAAIAGMSGGPQSYPTEKAYEWNFTIEKDLGNQMEVRASYMANLGRHLSRTVDVNGCLPGPTQCLSRAATDPTGRLYPQYGIAIDNNVADGQSEFNSVQFEFQKRFSHGMLFETNYSYARLFTYATADNPVGAPLSKYDWGPVAGNQLTGSAANGQPNNVFHFNYVYELPFGKGRKFGSSMNRASELVLGGWMLSGLGTWQSGDYLVITSGTGQTPTGATTLRADQISSANLPAGKQQSPNEWFNTAAFAQPSKVNPSAPNPTYNFGTSAIGAVRGPSFFSTDITLFKTFTITEHWHAQLRLDAYNPLNHPILGDPDTSVSDSNFGRILTSNVNYNPRSLQLGFKLLF